MEQEVIQDFLNLPGIAGIALMDGRSRPYFHGIEQVLNFQQKEALAQGILRVVETIPEGFETFEFQFSGYQVHIHKLDHGIVLLVLTRNTLVLLDYLKTIQGLKALLKEDISNAIATFRLMVANTVPGSTTLATATIKSTATPTPTPTVSDSSAISLPSTAANLSLKELLAALNHLSSFTTEYLGKHVIVNYWKSTCPDHDWLTNFQINRSAQFSFVGASSQTQSLLTTDEQQWIREWVDAFIKRCAQVIRDFPTLVEQKALNQEQKQLLLGT